MTEKQNTIANLHTMDLEQVRENLEALKMADVNNEQILGSTTVFGSNPDDIRQVVGTLAANGVDVERVIDSLQVFDSNSDEDSNVKTSRR